MDIERGTLKVTIEGSLMEVSDLRWSREARPIERHESGLGRKRRSKLRPASSQPAGLKFLKNAMNLTCLCFHRSVDSGGLCIECLDSPGRLLNVDIEELHLISIEDLPESRMSDPVANRDEHRRAKLDSLPNAPFCDERRDRRPDPLAIRRIERRVRLHVTMKGLGILEIGISNVSVRGTHLADHAGAIMNADGRR